MPCRCCQEGRCWIFIWLQSHTQSHTKTSKTLWHGAKVKRLVLGMGRQVGTKVTCNEGKGMRKRETFRTSQVEGSIFSRPSFSSVVEWHNQSVESDQPRSMTWLFRLCAFAFYSFQYFFWSAWFRAFKNTERRKSKAVVRIPNNQESASIWRMRCQIWLPLVESLQHCSPKTMALQSLQQQVMSYKVESLTQVNKSNGSELLCVFCQAPIIHCSQKKIWAWAPFSEAVLILRQCSTFS